MDTKELVEIAKDAIRKLSLIHKDDFIKREFTDEKSKCCAIGHLMRLLQDKDDYSAANCSDDGWSSIYRGIKVDGLSLAKVNNNPDLIKESDSKSACIKLLNQFIIKYS